MNNCVTTNEFNCTKIIPIKLKFFRDKNRYTAINSNRFPLKQNLRCERSEFQISSSKRSQHGVKVLFWFQYAIYTERAKRNSSRGRVRLPSLMLSWQLAHLTDANWTINQFFPASYWRIMPFQYWKFGRAILTTW